MINRERERELEVRERLEREAAAAAAARAAADEAERYAPVEVKSGRANCVLALKDGRHLSFAEAGDPRGFPVLCFFGIGGSRYLVLLLDDVARALGLRAISPDRPGFGRSTSARRSLVSFADDCSALCDHLQLNKLAIWGYSVGSAYAACCAMHPGLRRRMVARLTFISPWIPLTAPGVPMHFNIARFFPRIVSEMLRPNDIAERRADLRRKGGVETPFYLCGSFEEEEPDGDLTEVELRALEQLPRGPRVLLASIIEAQRQGPSGFTDEFTLCCSDFGFDYADVKWPVRVYHGTDDNLVSTDSIKWLIARLRSHVPAADVELFQVLGGTHNGMVFAILKRSLSAVANDIRTNLRSSDSFTFTDD